MVRRASILLAILVSFCASPAVAQTTTTALVFDSQPGDYIGSGVKQTWDESNLTFAIDTVRTSPTRIVIHGLKETFDGNPWWDLEFVAPDNSPVAE